MRSLFFAIALMLTAVPAKASTYTINISSQAGDASASGVITTDGAIGILAPTNILDWDIAVTIAGNLYALTGPSSGSTSVLQMVGNAVSASSTQLFFDFSSTGFSYIDFLGHDTVNDPAIFFSNADGAVPSQVGIQGRPYRVQLYPSSNAFDALNNQQVASVVTFAPIAAIPEPSTWAMLLLGFAAIASLRRLLSKAKAGVVVV